MKTLALLLLAVVALIHCQDQDEMTVFPLQGILEKLDGISDKLEDMQEKLEHLENSLSDMQQELGSLEMDIQELHHELEHVKGEAVNNQESMQRGHQEIKTFVHEEISRVITLAETDECSEGSHHCGRLGICEDSLFSFSCACPSGFTWDGSDCADIDECAEGKGACSPNAECKNSIGSFSCSCNKPFRGDGRTFCEFHCEHPLGVLGGLGCVERVEKKMTFREMKDFCQEEGGRMLQHLNQDYLVDIENAFDDWGVLVFSTWIGVYDKKWISDESSVPEDLWIEGYRSDPSRRCGILEWDSSSSSHLKVSQRDCSEERWGLCQFQLP